MKIRKKILVFALIFTMCLTNVMWPSKVDEVKAETVETAETADFETVPYTAEEARACLTAATKTKAAPAGYIFAGWYGDEACTRENRVSNIAESATGTYYAKYVPEGVLDVRVQVSKNSTVADGEQRNIRFVSSVDTLNYSSVGFELTLPNDEKKSSTTTMVSTRIKCADENDVYSYSPKVINAASEYMVTSIWKDVTNYDDVYTVRAFWKTLDGTTVYGRLRSMSVNDCLNNDRVTLSVADAEGTLSTGTYYVTYNNATGTVTEEKTVTVLKHDAGYTAIRINIQPTQAITKIEIKKAADGEVIASGSYRKFAITDTTQTITADTSWFDTNETTHVIASEAEFVGMTTLTDTQMQDHTFYLIKDMDLNSNITDMVAADKSTVQNQWKPIGGSGFFKGVFDGQGHEISGIYVNTDTNGGLFRGVNNTSTTNATVRNVTVANSYMIAATSHCGAIAGYGGGNFKNIRVKADVTVTSDGEGNDYYYGGIIGRINKCITKIEECWNSATITGAGYVGGICGNANNDNDKIFQVTVSNCLNDGPLTATASNKGCVAGMIGRTQLSTTIQNCVNTGKLTGSLYKGSIVGHHYTSDETKPLTISNCYTTEATLIGMKELYDNTTLLNYETGIAATGYEIYKHYKNLDFDNIWTATATGSPVLASLDEKAEYADVSWYGGKPAGTYMISTVADLYGFAMVVEGLKTAGTPFTGTVTLGSDIQVNTGSAKDWTEHAPINKWTPISDFQGTLLGNGMAISGIYVSNEATAGLFVTLTGAEVKNITFENSLIQCSGNRAGTVAAQGYGTFGQVYVKENVIVNAKQFAGGFVGDVTTGGETSFTQCWNASTVTATGKNSGGFTGIQTGGTSLTFTDCINTGTIETSGGSGMAAGFAGEIRYTTEMTNCISAGAVDTSYRRGSLVGFDKNGTLDMLSNCIGTTCIRACGNDGDVVREGFTYQTDLNDDALFAGFSETIWSKTSGQLPKLSCFQ